MSTTNQDIQSQVLTEKKKIKSLEIFFKKKICTFLKFYKQGIRLRKEQSILLVQHSTQIIDGCNANTFTFKREISMNI